MIWKMTHFLIFCFLRAIGRSLSLLFIRLIALLPLLTFCLPPLFLSGTLTLSAQTTAIQISCPEIDNNNDGILEPMTFFTSSLNCEATIRPPAPKVEADCFNWEWSFEVWGETEDPQSGEVAYRKITEDNNHIASGIPPGLYDIRYQISDFCGNIEQQECTLRVIDREAPAIACPEKYVVELRPENTGPNGTYVLDVAQLITEAGVSDNCGATTPVLRRTLVETDLADYARAQFGISWPEDFNRVFDEEEQIERFYSGGVLRFTRENGIFFTNWTERTSFDCADADEPPLLKLRIADAAGNTAHCSMPVEVKHKLPPLCRVENAVLTCSDIDFEPTDAAAVARRFGAPAEVVDLQGSCGVESVTEDIFWKPADCGKGRIERRFSVLGSNGLQSICTQVIQVEPVVRYQVQLPGDESRQHCSAEEESSFRISDMGCNLLAVSRDTARLEAQDDECYRLEVTHRIINWCEYDGDEEKPPLDLRTLVEKAGVVKNRVWLEINYDDWEGQTMRIYSAPQNSDPELVESFSEAAYRKMNPGSFLYSQIVLIYDNTPPEFQLQSENVSFCTTGSTICSGSFAFTFSLLDNCSETIDLQDMRLLRDGDPDQVLDEQSGAFSINRSGSTILVTGTMSIGSHRLSWDLSDACGNTATRHIDFEVLDCQAARPVCPAEQVIPLLPVDMDGDGEVESAMNTIWAEDLVMAMPEDCSGPLHFSLNRRGATPSREQQRISFNCDDPVSTPIPVELHAWDEMGNHDYCELFIILEDEQNRCNPVVDGEQVSGLIATESGATVAGVTMRLSGRQSRKTTTYTDGVYEFQGLQRDYDYTLQPWLNEDPLEGVTTFDLVLISKHILNSAPISSPYKLIAADVNNSKTITTLDMVQLRKIVLNIETELQNNLSWRFVDASYVFPNPANPWEEAFPEIISINNLAGDLKDQNFIAIKVGDVSGNAQHAGLAPLPEERSPARLTIFDIRMAAGETREIPLYLEEVDHLLGCQFTLETDLDILDVDGGMAREGNWGIFTAEGRITVSWNQEPAQVTDQNRKPLLYLKLRAPRSLSLREHLRITTMPTPAEAYSTDLKKRTLQLSFEQEKTATLTLAQNTLNPFRDQTRIHFHLPAPDAVLLRICNSQGMVLHERSATLPAGDHYFLIHRNQIAGSGLLFYTLQAKQERITRRMILETN